MRGEGWPNLVLISSRVFISRSTAYNSRLTVSLIHLSIFLVTMANSEKPFRVIVVGAGVVGLSLSHAFQLANIEHVVLEKHDSIVSYVGAALAILPHTARVFDQFGFLDKLNAQCTPLSKAHRRWPDGTLHSIDIGLNVAQKM